MWYLKKTRQTRKPTSAKWISWQVLGRIRYAKGFQNISSATVFCIIICLPPPPSSTFQAISQRTYYFLPIQLASKVYVVYFKPVCEINFCHGDQSIMRSHNLTCRMDLLQSSKVKTRMVTHKYIFEIYSIVNPTTGNDFFIALAMVPSFFINCIHTRKNQLF